MKRAIHTYRNTFHSPTHYFYSTYRGAGLASKNGSSLGLVHVEVLEVGLINLPGQRLLVGELRVFNVPVPCHHLRLQL